MKKGFLFYLVVAILITQIAIVSSCRRDGDGEIAVPTPPASNNIGNTNNVSGGSSGNGMMNFNYFVITDKDIFKGCDDFGDGTYAYLTQIGFGLDNSSAYYKGVTQMDVTIWATNGYFGSGKVGEKVKFTLYLSPTNLEYFKIIPIMSKDKWLNYHYILRYYDSNNKQWNELTSRNLTFYK